MVHWNRLSDHVGRKPVLLFGLLGTVVSITMFGLSRSFWSLALWYNFFDTLKYSLGSVTHFATVSQPLLEWRAQGNVGIVKSVLAEIADDSNVARAFSFLPLSFVVGQVIGFGLLIFRLFSYSYHIICVRSFVGGFLSRPQDRWPEYFPQPFWAEYPYFLPCLAVASFSLIQFTIAAIFFEEVGSLLF